MWNSFLRIERERMREKSEEVEESEGVHGLPNSWWLLEYIYMWCKVG